MNKGERIAEKEKELKALRQEREDLQLNIQAFQDRLSVVSRKIRSLENDLEQMKPKVLQVSDHAVLRYMERRHGIDVEEVRRAIADELKGAENLGDLKFAGYVIRGNTVVTYLPQGEE